MQRTIMIQPASYRLAVVCSAILVGMLGCESRHDRAVLDWVDAWPVARTGFGTSEAELEKSRSFNGETWEQQGRAITDAEETIGRLLITHDSRLDRHKAIHILSIIGTAKSVPVLTECPHDSDIFVRAYAVTGLAHIGVANDDVQKALVGYVNDESESALRISIARALAAIYHEKAIAAIKQHQKILANEASAMADILEAAENGKPVLPSSPKR